MSGLVDEEHGRLVARALAALGKHSLLLAIHDASFPSDHDEDLGRGSPYSRGGERFLKFASRLGMTGILFGPQGQTSHVNASPYDGTIFSKNVLSIALGPLCEAEWSSILDRQELAAAVESAPPGSRHHVPYRHVFFTQRLALWSAFDRFRALPETNPLHARHNNFCAENRDWLSRDAGFEALLIPDGKRSRRSADEEHAYYRFCQFVVHTQHEAMQKLAHAHKLRLYGDLQIGISHQDRTVLGPLFLTDYVMGAPPSRTNPEGQPWNYPVFDPHQYLDGNGGSGPVLAFMRARIAKLLREFDGLRIDHPHGLICPWVYKAQDPDALSAVQHGARLFSSPDLSDHDGLAQYAIAHPDQLNHSLPRHADGWVRSLTNAQVAQYALLFDVVLQCMHDAGRPMSDVLCEVLSTQPFPLRMVMDRHHMGRFRVTQKANLRDHTDGYRSENAQPEDFIMVGNHDTASLWSLIEDWKRGGTLAAQACYLADRLVPDSAQRASFALKLAANPSCLAQAKFAELFASPARHVSIFFADLFGMTQRYNLPGVISDENWSLRVPPDYEAEYLRRLSANAALNLPLALTLALRARGAAFTEEHRELLEPLAGLAEKLNGDALSMI